ncbi:MAG: tyrosine-type recombinase/integrase [Phycisphaerae bacterium]|nr:tyrosine-type recombinase/integrase [Phycisphaerae bacterium]
MISNSCSEDGKNLEHNVFRCISIRPKQDVLFSEFLGEQDVSRHTAEALIMDVRKFAKWFSTANSEPWDVGRVTVRDVTDFREYLNKEKRQATSTVNRCLASLRKYFKWLCQKDHVAVNPTVGVKELRRQPLAPQGLSRAEVRKVLREVELRHDIRAKAIFSLVLYTGARLSDVTYLELADLSITERAGTVFYRHGKGSKQRIVPLPLQGRKALVDYLQRRPPVESQRVFIGERGDLNRRGIQAVFEKYSALTGIENLHCHVLRHTFSHSFLAKATDGGAEGNLVQLASLLGHESLNTTAIYTKNSVQQLADAADRLTY